MKNTSSSRSLLEVVLSEAKQPDEPIQPTSQADDQKGETFPQSAVGVDEARITDIAINATGTSVSFTLELRLGQSIATTRWSANSQPKINLQSPGTGNGSTWKKEDGLQWVVDPRIYVYHLEHDILQHFSLSASNLDVISIPGG